MKRMKLFVKKNYIIIIPFFATFFLYLIGVILNKIYPFGNQIFIYSDMAEQYAVYFGYIKNMLLTGNNLFSSFSFSLGQNFYGILTYFCASPLNIIFLLSNIETMPIFVLALVMIKISLSSMTMAILLRSKLKNNLSILIFSVLYGLMTYNLVYSTNIMWLDPMYLLPLIVLGLEKLIDGKPMLYLVTLTLAMWTNYYIAFPVCIFLIMYFIYYELINKGEFKKHLISFIKYSIIAFLLSAVILIPTAFNMFVGKLETTSADFSFNLMYNLKFLIYKFLVGDVKNILSDLPFITSSLIVLVLTVTYLFNKNITIKDRIYSILMVAILIGITLFSCTDTIMHCFRIPNQFTCRYAFIVSFFLILISSKNFDDFNLNKKNILIYIPIGLIIFTYLKLYVAFKTIISSIIILIYFFGLLFIKDKRFLWLLMIPVLAGELLINIASSFNDFSRDKYNEYIDSYRYSNQIEALKPNQDDFYRITGLSKTTLNDPLVYSYYGISSFSPTISVNTNHLLKDYLGEPVNPSYAVEYLVATDFSDSLLNIKYKYKYDEEFEVYENKSVFPILFKITQNDRFKESEIKIDNQNNIYKYLSNTDEDLFIKTDNYSIEDCKIEDNYIVADRPSYCDFTTSSNKKTYLEIDSDSFSIIPIYDTMLTTQNYGYHMIFNLESVGRIYIADEKTKLDYIGAYEMDEEKLALLSERLNANKVNITSHNQSKITGNIVNEEDNQIIFTSIPYDEGWHVTINDKEVETFKNLDSLLAFNLPKGESKIELYFIPKGYITGLTISLLTFDLLVAIYVIKKKKDS